MPYSNTTREQDAQIEAAQDSDHISNLVAIIQEMDDKLTEWRDEVDSDDPRAVGKLIAEQAATIERLEGELKDALNRSVE